MGLAVNQSRFESEGAVSCPSQWLFWMDGSIKKNVLGDMTIIIHCIGLNLVSTDNIYMAYMRANGRCCCLLGRFGLCSST